MAQLWQCTEMLTESKSVTGRELSRRDQEQRWQNPWCASCLMSVLTCLFCACTNISIVCLHICERVPLQTRVSMWGLEIRSRLLRLLCTFPFLCFFFLFVQRLSLNLKLAVWTSLVGQWAPGIPLSLIFSTGIADTHQLPDFYLILGLELRSYCLYSEHFTGWAISPVPHISVCLRLMLGIPPLQSAWPKILLLGSRETPQHQPSNCYSSWARLHGLLWLMTSME